MLIPTTIDFTIYQGSSLEKTWSLVESGSTDPVDLSGYTARMQVRAKIKDEDAFLELTTENGGITISVETESTTLSLYADPATTAAIVATKGVYDIELIDVNGDVYRLMEGAITISAEVTR